MDMQDLRKINKLDKIGDIKRDSLNKKINNTKSF